MVVFGSIVRNLNRDLENMECNKDEAVRAKTIAEKKFEQRDYAGSKKFALKAQALYPQLDGISQMLTTLDVYLSAERRINTLVDWYGVLGVDPTTDDETIKKKYRKLALLLHPDKNPLSGADGAFKLISEAWSLLSDKAKRLAYNHQIAGFKVSHPKPPAQTSVGPSAGGPRTASRQAQNGGPLAPKLGKREPPAPKMPKKRSKTVAAKSAPAPSPIPKKVESFWTMCHECKVKYEYHVMYRNSVLSCMDCKKPFMAHQIPRPAELSRIKKPSHRPPAQQLNSSKKCSNDNNLDSQSVIS
ncbi:chaperone DnaJ-domain superfamily protein [Striga asiatica]|uniref:Chaperone DnaJ-domain superfamily protein n=1 Tax=Striga asiatica TaxID=4170 RepID=A0A5A7R0A5_STRAF|nr:chaperone DnaJ-domain superfamily protein [Striga asiatica]